MLASQLKVGDWIKPTRCKFGDVIDLPSVVTAIHLGQPEIRPLFCNMIDESMPTTHTLDREQEVELCS